MADEKQQDPLIASLMALAVSAAPLIQRARDSGLFKAGSREQAAAETAGTVVEVAAEPVRNPPAEAEQVDFAAQRAALQDIIVSQAMKIAALEAEVARLAAAAKSRPRKAN